MDQADKLRNIIKASQVASPNNARVITVTSGKGGVGKSNVAINLAVQFRTAGKRVLIFDADFGLANIEVMFGAIPKHSLADLIYQGASIRDVITWGPMGIGFISGGSGIAGMGNLSRDHLDYLIRNLSELDTMADVIIIDTAAGISEAVLEFLVASREIILVTTPEPTSITDSYSLLKALNLHAKFNKDETKVKVITNKVETTEEGKQLYSKLSAVVNRYLKLNMEFLGVIPYDNSLVKAVMQQSPVLISNPQAKAAKAFQDVANTLMDIPHTETIYRRGMSGFFANIISGRNFV
ncbi:MAG: MinD/ParA family protein [Lachnospiraceae bacterium]|nr:MinD/ParA family protein [Lachnospiraceae bacterium]